MNTVNLKRVLLKFTATRSEVYNNNNNKGTPRKEIFIRYRRS